MGFMGGFTFKIRLMFQESDVVSVKKIYNALIDESGNEGEIREQKHSIRSTLYSLKKNNIITRVGPGIYKKTK